MPMHRKNKSSWCGTRAGNQAWFTANKKRQRMRKKMARRSKQINRRVARG